MNDRPTREQLEVISAKLADDARKMGARGVIVAVSFEDDEHSIYWITHRGPCLEIEGLASRIASYVGQLWNGKITTRSFGATASVTKDGVVDETSVRESK